MAERRLLMRPMAALMGLACIALGAHAQDCQHASRNYEVSRNSMRPDQAMVDRAWQEMQAACGKVPAARQYEPSQPIRRGPGQFVNCDQAGCWGAQNGVRYSVVGGSNMQGTDGSFCARGAGGAFNCN